MRRSGVGLLLGLDLRRVLDAVRHPRAGTWVGVGLPALLVAVGAWLVGPVLHPEAATEDGRLLLGIVVAAPIALQAYPVLFRPGDDALLRRLGFAGGDLFRHRALRLLGVSAAVVALILIPFAGAGRSLGEPLVPAAAAALGSWATSLFTTSRAARRMARPGAGPGLPALFLGPDPALVRAGALVYAPLPALVAGAFAARLLTGPHLTLRGIVLGFVCTLLVRAAGMRFSAALPRFAPQAVEMAFAPPLTAGETGLVIGRGLAALLPRRAGVVRARDAAVMERRYRWAARMVWPVAVASVLVLLRAGHDPVARGWVMAAGGVIIALQTAAVVGLGRLERGGPRWIDRVLPLARWERLVGRWALAFGMSLGITLPLAITWTLKSGPAPWAWLAAGAAGAAVAATASLVAAGR